MWRLEPIFVSGNNGVTKSVSFSSIYKQETDCIGTVLQKSMAKQSSKHKKKIFRVPTVSLFHVVQ